MEKSIENIWKEGFESDKSFKLPVVKDLYTRKSNLIIDKIKSTTKWDNLSLIPMAVVLLGLFAFFGKLLLGIYVAALIISLFFLNRKMLKRLDQFNPNSNTYQYLINYQFQLKGLQRYYTKLLGIGLPLFVITAYWMYFQGTPIMISFMELDIYLQIFITAGITIILSGLGVLGYKLSTHLVYGKLLTRIEEIINDMEELMKI